MTAFSVLDLVPVRSGQTSAEAIAASMTLAETADKHGFARYWFAEHHNMPAVASTSPAVLIAGAAGRTNTIRVGSGGVMLPNHAPFIVAEQFAALEGMYPGRIDLGIGRAPGSDPVITHLLRQSATTSDVDRFPQHVGDILGMLSPDGATLRFTSGGEYQVRSTPAAAGLPHVWLLGSSDYSATLAASLGLPYVFANHFSGQGLERALAIYRDGFEPSAFGSVPRTFVTANVVAADTAEEAEARALPQLRMFAKLRMNRPLTALDTVEQALAADDDPIARQHIVAARDRWFVGTGSSVRSELSAFAARHDVEEVMIVPVAGSRDGEPVDRALGRERTLELVVGA